MNPKGLVAAGGESVQPTRLPAVPANLIAAGVSLRERTPDDADFIRDVYIAYRWPELAATGWPDAVKLAFLQDQHRLQDVHYNRYYEGAAWGVLEVEGTRAGRLYVFRRGADCRIVDIALLPAFRNQGLGGSLITAVQKMASEEGLLTVSIHVECSNPALRLYERLGFRLVETRGVYYLLEWPVAGAGAKHE